jgi:hypothetical protein
MVEEGWEDFGFWFGPFEVGFSGLGQFIKRTRTETSHVLRIRIDPAVKKEEIKARLAPYRTDHINRFGSYELKFDQVPEPIAEDLQL